MGKASVPDAAAAPAAVLRNSRRAWAIGGGERRCPSKLCIVPGMTIDPITVSVIQHRLESIVQEMGEAMVRTAYSQILNSSRDFSTPAVDGQGRLRAPARHVPIHLGAPPWARASAGAFCT